MSQGLIKPQLALSQGPQFSVTSAGEDEKDQECILGTEDYNNNEQLNKFNDLPTLSERNKGEILTLGEHTNHLAQEKGKHQSQAGTNQQVKSGKLKEGESRDCELQSRVETAGQFELTATGQSALSEAEYQEELEQNQYEWAEKRGEQLQVTELHHQSVELNQQEQTRMTEQIDEFYEQDKYLREQQQLDIQLQSQLETKQQELVTRMREQLNSFLRQKDLLREERQEQPELTAGLHNHSEIYQHDCTKEAGQENGIQGKEQQIKEEKQQVFELHGNQLRTNLQEVNTGLTRMKEQLNDLLAKDELVVEEPQQIADLVQNKSEGLRNEMTKMREKSNEFHAQDEILRQEQQRVAVLRNQLETNKQELTTIRKTELEKGMEYETLLRVERQRQNELQSQLEANRRNIALAREQMHEYEKQDELLKEERQRVTELENQLGTSRHDLGEITVRLTAFKREGEQLRGDNQERVSHLQSQLEIIRQQLHVFMGEQTNEIENQGERPTWQHKRVIQPQSLLNTDEL